MNDKFDDRGKAPEHAHSHTSHHTRQSQPSRIDLHELGLSPDTFRLYNGPEGKGYDLMPKETQPQYSEYRPSEVIYQVYPASFADANGDGHGDLKGITGKLDYIKSLGVDAVWISPFFHSPEGAAGDGGYAVTNYRKVGKNFGNLDDFHELLDEAHKRGLRVYTDFVLCHTSDEHEWFRKSCNKNDPEHAKYKDYYVWQEGKKEDGVPNNWKSCFTNGAAWRWNDERGAYYLHHFNTSQPALNLNNPKVQEAILREMEFWLQAGVDGLRIDALPFANHDPKRGNNSWRGGNCPFDENKERWDMQVFDRSMCWPETEKLVERIRKLLDKYPDKTAVGEVIAGREGGVNSPWMANKYIKPGTGLHTCYTESLIRFWEYPKASGLRDMLREAIQFGRDGGFCVNASNHDFPRAATRMTEKAPAELRSRIVRQLMAMSMSLPGSFCMYQGEELGLSQGRIPEDIPHDRKQDLVDPRCRDGARTPMPWDSTKKNAGFSPSDMPYLPVPHAHYARAVDKQENEPGSMLDFTRTLIAERKINPALSRGVTTVLNTDQKDPDIFAFTRKTKDQTVLLAFNMSGRAKLLKPSDYLDEKTLAELKIPKWAEVRVHAYNYARFGIRPVLGKEQPQPRLLEPGQSGTPLERPSLPGIKRVFAADMLIADHMVPRDMAAELCARHSLPVGGKRVIDKHTSDAILAAAPDAPVTLGGSTAISLWTAKQLMGERMAVNWLGVAPDDKHGRVVKDALKKAGIKLLIDQWPEDVKPEMALSHVMSFDGPKHSTVTYPGTEVAALRRQLAKPQYANLMEKTIRDDCDVVYLTGSMTQKFGQTMLEQILDYRWKYNKELVVTLPTHATFGPSDNQTYKHLIASANVVMGNDVEFCRLYDMDTRRPVDDRKITEVAHRIQQAFREDVLENNGRPCLQDQVAFITRGDKPSLIVTADKVQFVEAPEIAAKRNLLATGHASMGGFLAGYLKGLDHMESAQLGHLMAAAKIEQKEDLPMLEKPRDALDKAFLRSSLRELKGAYNSAGQPRVASRA